jgi:hypothetical protein
MNTAIALRRQELADRIMRIAEEKSLEQLEETLQSIELRERVEESMRAIERGDVIALEEFHKRNVEWLRENATK